MYYFIYIWSIQNKNLFFENPITWMGIIGRRTPSTDNNWRRTARRISIITLWESLPNLNLPDKRYLSSLCFSERHTPTERSAVNTPASDSFVICVRTLKSNLSPLTPSRANKYHGHRQRMCGGRVLSDSTNWTCCSLLHRR